MSDSDGPAGGCVPIAKPDFESAFQRHRPALLRTNLRAVALYELEGLRVVDGAPTRLLMQRAVTRGSMLTYLTVPTRTAST
jgi:hypothetical protein